jgi:hypothetical protein
MKIFFEDLKFLKLIWLKDFCQEFKMKKSGSKKELVNRIQEYLENEPEILHFSLLPIKTFPNSIKGKLIFQNELYCLIKGNPSIYNFQTLKTKTFDFKITFTNLFESNFQIYGFKMTFPLPKLYLLNFNDSSLQEIQMNTKINSDANSTPEFLVCFKNVILMYSIQLSRVQKHEKKIIKFNIETNEVEHIVFDAPLYDFGSSVLHENLLFIYSNPCFWVGEASLFIYDIIDDSWEEVSNELLKFQTRPKMSLFEGEIYFFGGYLLHDHSIPSNHLIVFNIESRSWKSFEIPHREICDIFVRDDIYFVGSSGSMVMKIKSSKSNIPSQLNEMKDFSDVKVILNDGTELVHKILLQEILQDNIEGETIKLQISHSLFMKLSSYLYLEKYEFTKDELILLKSNLKLIPIQDKLERKMSRNQFFQHIFTSKLHSDVKIKLGEHVIPSHKLILSTQSKYFKTMLCGEFEESKLEEIEIIDVDIDVFLIVLEFMYTEVCEIKCEGEKNLEKIGKLISYCDFLCFDSMKDYVLFQLSRRINEENVMKLKELSESLLVPNLLYERCFEYLLKLVTSKEESTRSEDVISKKQKIYNSEIEQ